MCLPCIIIITTTAISNYCHFQWGPRCRFPIVSHMLGYAQWKCVTTRVASRRSVAQTFVTCVTLRGPCSCTTHVSIEWLYCGYVPAASRLGDYNLVLEKRYSQIRQQTNNHNNKQYRHICLPDSTQWEWSRPVGSGSQVGRSKGPKPVASQ